MVWKKKEKELTPEEAVAQAKKALSDYWYRSTPIIIGVTHDNGSADVLPLDPVFKQKTWIIFLIDLSTYSGQSTIHYVLEWLDRFSQYNIDAMGVVKPRYNFIQNAVEVEHQLGSMRLKIPIVVDIDFSLNRAFRGTESPVKFLLVHNGQVIHEHFGLEHAEKFELAIQNFLRKTDPGLSLKPAFIPTDPFKLDTSAIEFGLNSKNAILSDSNKPPSGQPSPGALRLGGKWSERNSECVITFEDKATIQFLCSSPGFGLVASARQKTVEKVSLSVELDEAPVPETYAGEDIVHDDFGNSSIQIKESRLYHILRQLPPGSHRVVLTAQLTGGSSLSIYGIRFFELVRFS